MPLVTYLGSQNSIHMTCFSFPLPRYGWLLLCALHLLACTKTEVPLPLSPLSDEKALQDEQRLWESWSAERGLNRKSSAISSVDNDGSPPSKGELSEKDAGYQLIYEAGYSFPTLVFRVYGELVTVPLQPPLKRLGASEISRIAVSPDHLKVAVVFGRQGDRKDAMSVINLQSNAIEFVVPDVYDATWGNDSSLLFYTTTSNGIPSVLYAHRGGKAHRVLSATVEGESILIERSLRGALKIIRTCFPSNTSVGILPFDLQNFEATAVPFYKGSAVAQSSTGIYILSYERNKYGEVTLTTHLNRHRFGKAPVLESGRPGYALLNLVETSDGVVIYTGSGHTRGLTLIEGRVVTQRLTPPPPLQQLTASFSNQVLSIFGESVLCPREKLGVQHVAGFANKYPLISLREHSCKDTSIQKENSRGKDGSLTPLTLIKFNGPQRGYAFFSYGAYGQPLPLHYSERLAFLAKEGFTVAMCHTRGGGEFGPWWHEASRLKGKTLTISDAESCIKSLSVDKTAPLISYGYSAGGWLISQLMKRSVGGFAAVLLDAPMVELPTLKDRTVDGLNQREMFEWGAVGAESAHPSISKLNTTRVFTVIRTLDRLLPPNSIVRWLKEIRKTSQVGTPVISLLAEKSSHGATLQPEVERTVLASWRELLRDVGP